MSLSATERCRRSRARKRGEDIPRLPGGPKIGYKQTAQHIAKRIKRGSETYNWRGDNPPDPVLRKRARRLIGKVGKPCVRCKLNPSTDRHHKDGNIRNNSPRNIRFLCKRCHIIEDGNLPRRPKLYPGEVVVPVGSPLRTNPIVSCGCGCGATFTMYDKAWRVRVYRPGHNDKNPDGTFSA